MGFRYKHSFLLLCIICLIGGCGTTHHFLPSRPLDNEDWMISVAWHYDLNGLHKSARNIFPDVNAYMGIGKNYNFGFGARAPFFISHASLVKYFDMSENNNWALYAHMNEIFGVLINNPRFEIGGIYTWKNKSIYQSISLGVGYGQESAWLMKYDSTQSPRLLLPTIKYNIMGSELGASWAYYHGQTKASVIKDLVGILEHNDTLYIYEPGELDSISLLVGYDYASPYKEKIIFHDSRGPSAYAYSGFNPPDAWYLATIELQNWLGDKYKVCHFSDNWRDVIILDLNKLQDSLERGERVIITRYPDELVDKIENINGVVKDNSFGLGIFSYPK